MVEVLEWVDKQNQVDIVDAEDINAIANALISTQSAVNQISEEMQNVESSLDAIIELQESYM